MKGESFAPYKELEQLGKILAAFKNPINSITDSQVIAPLWQIL